MAEQRDRENIHELVQHAPVPELFSFLRHGQVRNTWWPKIHFESRPAICERDSKSERVSEFIEWKAPLRVDAELHVRPALSKVQDKIDKFVREPELSEAFRKLLNRGHKYTDRHFDPAAAARAKGDQLTLLKWLYLDA